MDEVTPIPNPSLKGRGGEWNFDLLISGISREQAEKLLLAIIAVTEIYKGEVAGGFSEALEEVDGQKEG